MAGLLRWQIFGIYGVLFLSIWLGARQALSSQQQDTTSWMVQLAVDWAPLWAILLLGVYAVAWIAYGVVTLRDDEDAARELEQQVKQARIELQKRGILKKE